MAKSLSADKRENEKKRLAKRAEKQKKKEEKRLSGKTNSFDDMIAYVDENGMITSTPPELNSKKEEIKLEEIIISTPKKEDEIPVILKGRVRILQYLKRFRFYQKPCQYRKVFFSCKQRTYYNIRERYCDIRPRT